MLGFRELAFHLQPHRDFAAQRRVRTLQLAVRGFERAFVVAALQLRGGAAREEPQQPEVGLVPVALALVLHGDVTDDALVFVHHRDREVALDARAVEIRPRGGEQVAHAAREAGDVAVEDRLAGRAREVERLGLAERAADPDGEDVRLVLLRVDLGHESEMGLERSAERSHQLREEGIAGLRGDARADHAHQLRHLLAACGARGKLLFGVEPLGDFASQLGVRPLQRRVHLLQTALVILPRELRAGAGGENAQDPPVGVVPVALAVVDDGEMAADLAAFVGKRDREVALRADRG